MSKPSGSREERLVALVKGYAEGHQHRKPRHRLMCVLCREAMDLGILYGDLAPPFPNRPNKERVEHV